MRRHENACKLGKNTVVVEPRSGENSARGGKGRKENFRRVRAPQAGWYTRRARSLSLWAGARARAAPGARPLPAPAGGEEG